MNKDGEIIVIDDDREDIEFFIKAFRLIGIKNHVICFSNVAEAVAHLNQPNVKPYYIVSDYYITPHIENQLRRTIVQELGIEVPIILFSTSVSENALNAALISGFQGFFEKPTSMEDLQSRLRLIHQYMDLAFSTPI